ncbi:MAG TPA: hypothetical protein VNF46_06510 [Gammaproteobacteria bacterium]|nr:hypothetical protein [Gammaproteobacteria bacterium]
MGAFSSRPDIIIENQPGWEKGEYIKIKGVLTAGDMDAVTQGSSVVKNESGEARVVGGSNVTPLLEAMIIDWLLLGDQGVPVPLYLNAQRHTKNRKAIAALPQEYTTPVLEAIDQLNKKDAVDADPFFAGAGAPTTAS